VSEHFRLSFCPSVCLSVTEKACPFVRQLMSGWTRFHFRNHHVCACLLWGRGHDARCRTAQFLLKSTTELTMRLRWVLRQ
jgi:hypothetical protein